MKPQEYEVAAFNTGDEPYLDNYGNTWCNVAFKGISEPVRWVVKDPSKVSVGDIVYGHIEEVMSRAGKPYNRFKTDKREEVPAQASGGSGSTWTEDPDKQAHISRSVALNNAVLYANSHTDVVLDDVIDVAETFLKWLNPQQTQEEKDITALFSERDVPSDMEDRNDDSGKYEGGYENL